jgi:hypothetical protein
MSRQVIFVEGNASAAERFAYRGIFDPDCKHELAAVAEPGRHPLIPVVAMPRVKYLWARAKEAASGNRLMMAPAISTPCSTTYWPANKVNPAGSVRIFVVEVTTSGQRKSFQLFIK